VKLGTNVPSRDDIRAAVERRLFGENLVQSNFRGEVVESIISKALGPSWIHCSEGWGGWDFEKTMESGALVRLQVKQSAARQSWQTTRKPTPSFRIAEVSGYYKENGEWRSDNGRHAEIFVFGWHGDTSELADHFDAKQWIFYVVAESQLKKDKRKNIPLSDVQTLATSTEFAGLKHKVEKLASSIGGQPTPPSPPATS
jgi:hypothetical protein